MTETVQKVFATLKWLNIQILVLNSCEIPKLFSEDKKADDVVPGDNYPSMCKN